MLSEDSQEGHCDSDQWIREELSNNYTQPQIFHNLLSVLLSFFKKIEPQILMRSCPAGDFPFSHDSDLPGKKVLRTWLVSPGHTASLAKARCGKEGVITGAQGEKSEGPDPAAAPWAMPSQEAELLFHQLCWGAEQPSMSCCPRVTRLVI